MAWFWGGVPGPEGEVFAPRGLPGPSGVPGPGGLVSQHALRQTPPPGETATAADGTHLGLLESDGKFFS